MNGFTRALKRQALIAVSIAPAILGFVSAPVDAALLTGYVSQTGAVEQERVMSASVSDNMSSTRPDSFPNEMQGGWQCVTVVIDSLVDSVPVGQKMVSRVDFVKTKDGRVVARFLQPGWTEAQESVSTMGTNKYQVDKTNYYYGPNSNGSWAARSRDRYQILEKNRMITESEVDQYADGCYMGRYRTRSTLVRLNTGTENVAAAPMPDPDDHSGDGNPFMNK